MTTPTDDPRFSLLVVRDCPNEAPAAEAFEEALALVGRPDTTIRRVLVDDAGTAQRLGFTGSPSFHVDGHDLFPASQEPSVACRLYRGPDGGLAGVPTVSDLTEALRRQERDGGAYRSAR